MKERPEQQTSSPGVGAGIRLAISKYLTARAYVGIPLMNCGVYDQASARLHFDIIASPF